MNTVSRLGSAVVDVAETKAVGSGTTCGEQPLLGARHNAKTTWRWLHTGDAGQWTADAR